MLYRSYFDKNNTIISSLSTNNLTNNSQNPVTEVSWGTVNTQVSRYIFAIDVTNLKAAIDTGEIKQDQIQKHTLKLTNTIRYTPDRVGGKFSDQETERAGSFTLQLFNINEDWDEGNGYDFVYDQDEFPQLQDQASNWVYKKTGEFWNVEGIYLSGSTEIIGTQYFDKGNEDFEVDITDYVNSLLFTGTTGFTGTTFGLGIKFTDDLEQLATTYRNAVGFHTKYSDTYFEPYVETEYDNSIEDDRNYFYMNKDNDLFLYYKEGSQFKDLTVNSVTILDYEDNIVEIITGASISSVRKGIYKVTTNIDSDIFPDQVLFTDRWNVTYNGKTKDIDQEFYLINDENYFSFELDSDFNENNYHFNIVGLRYNEKFKRGDKRRIKVNVKQFYGSQANNIPIELEYRIYSTQSDDFQFDVIPWTKLDRTINGYEFTLDTSWLIPYDYFVEVRLSNSMVITKKNPINFTVISDGTTNS